MGNSWIIIGIALGIAVVLTGIVLFVTRKHAEEMRKEEGYTLSDKEGMKVLKDHEESLKRLVEKAQRKGQTKK
ncbi:MAG: hypothetical protein IIY44_00365 [Erysipelotrichales bacterium]|nr:hypothetical protein [Erysipelotrichales bacterium]MBQ1385770.1 hypothetical protein [Erysipelotrichales bacterium]MBQ2310429.1 hypothetical protein [Erysipelotrichales bacterium]MBQ2477971.1 hypothetical protein [Erysipelotrichales bacterium]MBQ4375917.1 hypothetical protein [Erysipelotrichales bacterium]